MFSGITTDIILLFIILISFLAVFSALVTALIKKAFGNKLSPSFHYYIWFVFVLRLLFPLMPESNLSVYNLAAGIYQNITNPSTANVIIDEQNTEVKDTVRESSTETIYEPSDYTTPKENTTVPMTNTGSNTNEKTETSIPYIIFIVYLSVAAGSLIMYIVRHQIYRRRIIKSFGKPGDGERQLLNQVKAKLNIRAKIQLYKGDESILIGVFSPIMVISNDCADSDKAAVMTHELLHYKNRDNFVNSLLILIKCIYWFNPFIHYFIRKMKDDMELLCDIKSIQKLNYRKDEYAMMLFNASNKNKKKNARNIPAQATSMSASGKQLIYRLKFISAFRKSSKLVSVVAVALVTVLIATTLTNPIMALGNDWAESYAQFLTQEGVYDYTGVTLSGNIKASEYAEVVFNAFKSMTIPYEAKIKALTMKDGGGILDIVNATLNNADKISPDKAVTREQAAYITDTVINHLGFYAETEGSLSFVPAVLTAEMFENELLAKMDEGGREIRRLQAFYAKKDLNDPNLTELAKQELLMKYPSFANVLKQTAIYIFDPLASARELLEILNYYNNYTTLTDADIAKMYIDYGIISTNINYVSESLDPLCISLPYINTGDIPIEDLYIKTTLADKSLTKEEYNYMLESYLQTYVRNNYNYYKLKDNVTAAQKKEIAEIVSNQREYSALVTEIISAELGVDYPDTWMLKGNTSDVPEESWDKYEKFDDEYDIPIVVEQSRLDYIFALVYKNPQEVPEEEIQKNEQDREKLLGYYELVNYASEHMNVNPEEVTVYKLRDDISEKEYEEINSELVFGSSGRDTVSIFEINGACEYKDISNISDWARESVEKMHLTGFMTGVPGEKFNPNAKLTWGQSAKIINNLICGIIVH